MICQCLIEIIFFIQISHMSVLSQKLQEAARLFQTHNFKQSLDAYQDCLSFCRKTDECESVILNISSAKASLEYILGDYDSALCTLNGVLRRDPYHFLALLKRSQVYKKKNKLKRALKDLETIYVFAPDNLQISAFKTEIQHLLLKQEKEHDITSDSEEEEEEEEEAQLNFCKLKQIDRKSIDNSSMKQRKSRVTILGDSTFEYRIDQDPQQSSPAEDYCDKALRTYKEIELDDDEDMDSMPIIQIKAPKQKKSILKNKGTSIFIQADDAASRRSRYLGRESKLLALIKNIDGKIIPSADHEHSSNPTIKEVEFRKSTHEEPEHFLTIPVDNISTVSSKQRKSCLKRPSFDIPEVKVQNKPLRRSKFQSIDATKIDGHLIVNPRRKSIQNNSSLAVSQGQYDHVKPQSDSDNDGSEHNIFGSKPYVLSQDMKQKLGLTEDLSLSLPVQKHAGKKSILKRNSSLVPIIAHKKESILAKGPPTLKSKKSVMFNCTL